MQNVVAETPTRPALRRELENWIDQELAFYVANYINDADLAILHTNLVNIAEAHAWNVVRGFSLATPSRRHVRASVAERVRTARTTREGGA